jgi:CRISPR/Cas system-associated exonuclease Cas4 (RecB family)
MPFHKREQRLAEEETFVGKFTASKSLLEKYFSGCSHRAYLYKRWNMKKEYMPKQLQFGIEVHDLIERGLSGENLWTKDKLEFEGNAEALERAERAINWCKKNGYTVLALEERHYATLTDDINLFGVIDCIAEKDGETILIDWKTASRNWTTTKVGEDGDRIYIGAQGWQGPVYLTTPNESSIIKPSAWPTEMLYVVIPKNGTIGAYRYTKNEADDQALLQACQVVKNATDQGWFPKNQGTWTCDRCDFKHVCWKTPGWEKYYDKRRTKK